ncbi:uncharacterized protein LOC132855376 [Tachysurus vachellii]|uniref:uncharacterized protein LOC132854192 n=1 Tax=Tachysurus vachellii TaxID=175792 RepID=UPI00296B5517|nr:uncharacterized protein LOC132854192 [Tachysurus vachellii]XP_060740255.1 uncharacterized protein LOC132855376 [Tachysurus vachellii]
MKFALVSWSKGKDKDALSIVPVNWIVDFDPENSKKEYLIECRCIGGKRPTNGWTVETAHILQLAENESTLKTAEQKLLQEDLPKSKKRKRVPNKLYLDTQEVEQVAKKKNYRLIAARQSELEVLRQEEPNLSPVGTSLEALEEEIRALREENKRLQDQQSVGSSAASKDLETQVKALHKENTRLCKMAVKEIPSLLAAVRTLISDKITESSSNGDETEYEASVALPSPPQPTPPKPTSVPLGNDDSTRVSAHCWETAKAQPTAKAMARTLLLGLFSIDVLLKSNLTGGVNKVDPSAERRQPLDPKKLTALLNAVVQQHPGAKIPDIRTAINKKICELRHQEKKKSMDN